MGEILKEVIACHKEEPLPTSPCTGLNILRNADCSIANMIEVTKGLAATIKNREDYHNLCFLLYEEQITKL